MGDVGEVGGGGGEVKKCWKYNIAERVAFRGSGERGRIKTKMKLKMSHRDVWEGEEEQYRFFSDDHWPQIIYD